MKLKPSEAILYHMPSVAALFYAWLLAAGAGLLLMIEPALLRSEYGRGALFSLIMGIFVHSASILQSRRALMGIARRVEELEKPGE